MRVLAIRRSGRAVAIPADVFEAWLADRAVPVRFAHALDRAAEIRVVFGEDV